MVIAQRTAACFFTAFLSALLVASRPALADAIDGHWCSDDGRLFSIRGPSIVTPAGTATQGDYSRHAFSYVVPANEADGGTTVYMILLSEEFLNLSLGAPPGSDGTAIELWHRCQAQIS